MGGSSQAAPTASPTPAGPMLATGAPTPMGAAAPTVQATATSNPNIFDSSANWMQQAAQGYQPGMIADGMGNYQNPYQQQVIDNTQRQMREAYELADMNLTAEADAAGAFGGSRHGLAQAELASDFATGVGDMTARMNQSGFNTAAQLAQQDIGNTMAGAGGLQGLANQGFNMGRQLNQDQFAMGQQAQMLQQQIMNSAMQMFGGMTPQGYLGGFNQGLTGSPLMGNGFTQQTQTPGLGQSIGAGLAVGSRIMGK